jgi:hypothetical protein
MTSYDVGQVVYVVSSQKMQVLPFVISEEVVRKTLAGQDVTYLVKRDKTNKTYNLAEIQGDVYVNIDDVRNSLIINATNAIEKICDQSCRKGESLTSAPRQPKPQAPSKETVVNVPTDEDLKSFVLDDGTRVRVNMQDM